MGTRSVRQIGISSPIKVIWNSPDIIDGTYDDAAELGSRGSNLQSIFECAFIHVFLPAMLFP